MFIDMFRNTMRHLRSSEDMLGYVMMLCCWITAKSKASQLMMLVIKYEYISRYFKGE